MSPHGFALIIKLCASRVLNMNATDMLSKFALVGNNVLDACSLRQQITSQKAKCLKKQIGILKWMS